MASVDDLKSIVNKGRGLAKQNQFMVQLPSIAGVSSSQLNLLCSRVSLPGKQVLTHDRRINMQFEKIAYGYGVDDVSMSFYLLNDYAPRKYFDSWRSIILNEDTFQVGYKQDYASAVKVFQLKRPFSLQASLGPINFSFTSSTDVIYGVELKEAFPTTIQQIDFSNELDGLLEVTVQLSYTNWKSI